MPANPTTDQYLATIKTKLGGICKPDCGGSDHVVIDRTIEVVTDGLPDVDPAVIGQVMLHMAMIQSDLATNSYTSDMPPAHRSRFIINCTALAAAQLITGVDYTRSEAS